MWRKLKRAALFTGLIATSAVALGLLLSPGYSEHARVQAAQVRAALRSVSVEPTSGNDAAARADAQRQFARAVALLDDLVDRAAAQESLERWLGIVLVVAAALGWFVWASLPT